MSEFPEEIVEIHRKIQLSFVAMILLCAWVGSIVAAAPQLTYYCVAVMLLCGLSLLIGQVRFALATYVFAVGLWALTAIMVKTYPDILVVSIFAVQIPVISHLTNNRTGALVALVSSLTVASAHIPNTMTFIVLIWMLWGLGLILSRGLVEAIAVSSGYQRYLLIQMDESRASRASLASLTKSLSEAQERLQHVNSQLRQARDLAEEARRLKARFAANVSHELRTPINLIVGFSEVIATTPEIYGVPLPSAYRSDIRTIFRNAKHLQSLISDILDISQIDAEHLAIIKEHCDLRTVLLDTTDIARAMVEEKGLYLNVEVPPALPRVWVDQTRIRQIILNLLSNSTRFTRRGGITLSAHFHDPATVRIDVHDTGIGIQAQELDRVFDEFYQVSQRQASRGGSGLGLALSRRLVEQHGGRMWAISDGVPDNGSTFSFTLPLSSNVSFPPGLSRTDHNRPTVQPKIVIADPDPAVRHLFRGYIRKADVIEAENLNHILPVILSEQPTAIVINLRELDGTQIDHIETVSPSTMLIRADLPSGKRTMQEKGIFDYLVKPISRETILTAIGKLRITPHKILVVDDEPDVVRMFRRMFQSALPSCAVLHAFGGRDGLQRMRDVQPDLVILDIEMPGIDGLSVIEVMRSDATLSDIPVIVASAKGSAEAIVSQLAGEIRITRPSGFQPIELVNCLDAFISQLKPHFDPVASGKPID